MKRKTDVGNGFVVQLRAKKVAIGGLSFADVLSDFEINGVRGEYRVGLPKAVGSVAAPAVVRGVIYHDGLDWVEFDVAHVGEQLSVRLNERRFVAAIPEGPCVSVGLVR